jgi:hypothetical protein
MNDYREPGSGATTTQPLSLRAQPANRNDADALFRLSPMFKLKAAPTPDRFLQNSDFPLCGIRIFLKFDSDFPNAKEESQLNA